MLSFVEKGNGIPLLLLHAFPLDHSMWFAQADHFRARYRVVMPDLPGFGDSKPVRPWTISDIGNDLQELLDKLKIETCMLAGLSLGGYIALPFAARHPRRISKLVLAHTRARADTDIERAGRNDMIATLRKDGTEALPGKMLSRLLGPAAPATVREWVTQTIQRVDANAAIHAIEAMRDRADSTPSLQTIQCPTLVIAGDGDAIMKVEDARSMAAALPRGTLAVIPNTGHLSNLEDPPAFNRVLEEFLIVSEQALRD
jgi:pimeloyl-ACP methyl ester carboxylesterase